jgi:hypothetical protein
MTMIESHGRHRKRLALTNTFMSTNVTDTYGDGLTDGNGLSLSYNGNTILSIPLYDTGTYDEVASYWAIEMGDCGGSIEDNEEKNQGDTGVVDDGNDQGGSNSDDDGSSTDDSCFDVVVALTTDSEANEMLLLISEVTDLLTGADVVSSTILLYNFGDLIDNSIYEDELS